MILNIWKAFRVQLKELKDRILVLEDIAHEPQNYKKKCDEMEKRIKALEKKVHMIR
jgi:hypothetical protein